MNKVPYLCNVRKNRPGEASNLSIPQVGVSSEQDGHVIGRLRHPLHHQPQLLHPLCCIGLTALKVGRHETELLAPEQHLIGGGPPVRSAHTEKS